MESDNVEINQNTDMGENKVELSPVNSNHVEEVVKKTNTVTADQPDTVVQEMEVDENLAKSDSEKKNGIQEKEDTDKETNSEKTETNSATNHELVENKLLNTKVSNSVDESVKSPENKEVISIKSPETKSEKSSDKIEQTKVESTSSDVNDDSAMDVDIPSEKSSPVNGLEPEKEDKSENNVEDSSVNKDSNISLEAETVSKKEEESSKPDSSDKDSKEKSEVLTDESSKETKENETADDSVTKESVDTPEPTFSKESTEAPSTPNTDTPVPTPSKESTDAPSTPNADVSVPTSNKESTDAPSTPNADTPTSEGKVKKKKKKTCEECGTKKKKLKFQVLFQNKTRYLCSSECFDNFKKNQKSTQSPAPDQSAAEKSKCAQCQKDITAQGYYPINGDIKPLCSEECLKKHNKENMPCKSCSQCKKVLENKVNPDVLSWETMMFCNEECLGKFQSYLGSHCTCCQSPVPQSSLGKYSVCFGSDIRQFCSCSCLDEFKKNLKVCSFCQTDLSAGVDSFLAPVGDKGQFKDFCSQNCMERYEVNNLSKSTPQSQVCTNCKKQGTFKTQIKHDGETFALCSDLCVAAFRCSQKVKDKMCDTCFNFFAENPNSTFSFKYDGQSRNFCTKACMTLFVLSHRKIVACVSCKVKKYNFDMIEKTDLNNATQIFCSLNCLSLYRVSMNAASSKNVICDHCKKVLQAQYHLTMSDGSVRDFCTYNCVIAFQTQYTNVCTLTTTSATRQAPAASSIKTTATGNSPVISNVISLAGGSPRPTNSIQIRSIPPQKFTQFPMRPPVQPVAIIGQKIFAISPGAGLNQLQAKSNADQQTVATFLVNNDSKPGTVSSPQPTMTSSGNQHVIREVIVKPPAPKSQKNKSVACKPIMLHKGINAKPTPCHKAVQTDDSPRTLLVPVPIPIYIPTPVMMFSRPVPCPVPFPLPIPVPVILPKEISKEKEPSNTVENNNSGPAPMTNCGNTNDVAKGFRNSSGNYEDMSLSSDVHSSDEYNDVNDHEGDEYAFKDGKSGQPVKRPLPGSEQKSKPRKRSRMDDLVVEEARAHIIPQSEENHSDLQKDQTEAAPHLKVP